MFLAVVWDWLAMECMVWLMGLMCLVCLGMGGPRVGDHFGEVMLRCLMVGHDGSREDVPMP